MRRGATQFWYHLITAQKRPSHLSRTQHMVRGGSHLRDSGGGGTVGALLAEIDKRVVGRKGLLGGPTRTEPLSHAASLRESRTKGDRKLGPDGSRSIHQPEGSWTEGQIVAHPAANAHSGGHRAIGHPSWANTSTRCTLPQPNHPCFGYVLGYVKQKSTRRCLILLKTWRREGPLRNCVTACHRIATP
jgi:hypothetical protein